MSSLHLRLGDDEDPFPPSSYETKSFAILQDHLQPDTRLSQESTANSILDLLPENEPHSGSVWDFGGLCIELAEQIPYYHPSQLKLAEFLRYIGMSTKLGKVTELEGLKSRQFHRYQQLGESLRESLNGPNPGCPPSNYVNFHAFAANLFERRIFTDGCTWAIWALREAHEEHHEEEGNLRDIYVLSGAQWILWYGQSFFEHVIYPGEISDDDLRCWTPGPLYNGTKFLSLHRWQFWKQNFRTISSGGRDEEKGGYSQECRSVSAKAANIMDALEKNMTF